MAENTVEVDQFELDAESVIAALDMLDDESRVADDAVIADGVAIKGDGYSDHDVNVAPASAVTFDGDEIQFSESAFTSTTRLRRDAEPPAVDQFSQATGIEEGESLQYGTVERMNETEPGVVRIDVSNSTYDEVHSSTLEQIRDGGYKVVEIDFDNGHFNVAQD